jgi:hypothetical protein
MNEKIKYLLQRLAIAQSDEEKENLVRLALRAQDMDTRGACFDAIYGIPPLLEQGYSFWKNYFGNIILNCKGGVE